uniref:Putative secreted protein n=1 Tax=Ixodes ricinus TaxID=34613 RepID=A0A6B0U8Z3_IXORI
MSEIFCFLRLSVVSVAVVLRCTARVEVDLDVDTTGSRAVWVPLSALSLLDSMASCREDASSSRVRCSPRVIVVVLRTTLDVCTVLTPDRTCADLKTSLDS